MHMPALKYTQIHQGFYTFLNEDVLPTCGIEVNVFWQAMEELIADYAAQPSAFINDQVNSQLAANTKIAPVIDSQQLIQAANSKWTSLFDATLSTVRDADEMNTSQLKIAEPCVKDYLDKHFPLATGSHADVKSYVVYYHHLLAFFDDGEQSGLDNPSQFVALCGHKCAPDSIVLKQSSTKQHIEIVIDRKGSRGSKDNAGIEAVLVETNEAIVVDFDAVHIDGESKIQAYKNLQSFLAQNLKTVTMVNGQQTICRMNKDVTFTDLNGDDYCIANQSSIQIRCAKPSLLTELMRDDKNSLTPQVIVDAVITSLMLQNAKRSTGSNKPASLLLEKGAFTTTMMQRVDGILAL